MEEYTCRMLLYWLCGCFCAMHGHPASGSSEYLGYTGDETVISRDFSLDVEPDDLPFRHAASQQTPLFKESQSPEFHSGNGNCVPYFYHIIPGDRESAYRGIPGAVC